MQFQSSNEPLKAIHYYKRGVLLGDSPSHYVRWPIHAVRESHLTKVQQLGMMILLGQYEQQNYAVGLDHIKYAAQTCDENAPQGAYVSRSSNYHGLIN